MTIGEKIKETFRDFNIPCYYIKRPQGSNNCIVYTYTESPSLIGDCKELGTKYTILFNLYCKSSVEINKSNLKRLLQDNGFIKKNIFGTILEDNEMYNTAFQYTISLKQ